MNSKKYLVSILVAGGLSACGGGGGDAPPEGTAVPGPVATPTQPSPWAYQACNSAAGANPAADVDAAADGIWQGTLTNETAKATEPYTAIVTPDGRFRLLSTGHTQMAGTLDVEGNGYTGDGFARSGGKKWHDGTLISELATAGKIEERERLEGDFALASGDAGCFTLVYDADLYERPSSLDLVAGRWVDYDDWSFLWLALDVSAQGEFSAFGLYGCVYTGKFEPIDPRFNLYAVNVRITQSAQEAYTCYSPGNYDGLAYLADTGDGSNANYYLRMSLASGNNALRLDLHR